MILRNPRNSEAMCLAFCNRNIIIRKDSERLSFSDLITLSQHMECHDIIEEREYDICALGIKNDAELPEGYTTMLLRLYLDKLDAETAMRISRAKALTEWHSTNRFCNRCGKPLSEHKELTAMICNECGNILFPRIEPCIIVLVRRGEKMLLARHVQRNQNIYACIAGFMEAGESAEQCVKREVMEETGISIKNIRYFGSQSWPYPSQLMIAFTAEYESGELKLQKDEIADAGWFDEKNSPATPPPGSIAYRLIHNIKW